MCLYSATKAVRDARSLCAVAWNYLVSAPVTAECMEFELIQAKVKTWICCVHAVGNVYVLSFAGTLGLHTSSYAGVAMEWADFDWSGVFS